MLFAFSIEIWKRKEEEERWRKAKKKTTSDRFSAFSCKQMRVFLARPRRCRRFLLRLVCVCARVFFLAIPITKSSNQLYYCIKRRAISVWTRRKRKKNNRRQQKETNIEKYRDDTNAHRLADAYALHIQLHLAHALAKSLRLLTANNARRSIENWLAAHNKAKEPKENLRYHYRYSKEKLRMR